LEGRADGCARWWPGECEPESWPHSGHAKTSIFPRHVAATPYSQTHEWDVHGKPGTWPLTHKHTHGSDNMDHEPGCTTHTDRYRVPNVRVGQTRCAGTCPPAHSHHRFLTNARMESTVWARRIPPLTHTHTAHHLPLTNVRMEHAWWARNRAAPPSHLHCNGPLHHLRAQSSGTRTNACSSVWCPKT